MMFTTENVTICRIYTHTHLLLKSLYQNQNLDNDFGNPASRFQIKQYNKTTFQGLDRASILLRFELEGEIYKFLFHDTFL